MKKLLLVIKENLFLKISCILFVVYSMLYAFIVLWGEVIGIERFVNNPFLSGRSYVVLPFDIGLYNMSNGDLMIGNFLLKDTIMKDSFIFLFIFILLAICLRFKDSIKSKRFNSIIGKIMAENSFSGDAIRKFLEIRRIDSLNWLLVFVYLLCTVLLMINLEGGALEIEPIFSAIIFGLSLRLIFLLYYFFGRFTHTRFNIITLILIGITIYSIVNPI